MQSTQDYNYGFSYSSCSPELLKCIGEQKIPQAQIYYTGTIQANARNVRLGITLTKALPRLVLTVTGYRPATGTKHQIVQTPILCYLRVHILYMCEHITELAGVMHLQHQEQ
jgi:hypothetical protein